MKSPSRRNPLLLALCLTALLDATLAAQELPGGAIPDRDPARLTDTNQLLTATAELQSLVPVPETPRLFVNTPDLAERLAAAQQVREAQAAARAAQPEAIELLPEGALARFGPHQVLFPPDTTGLIELRTPQGQTLRSRVVGLCYWSESGQSVMLAELKATPGELAGPGTVIYPNAFAGVAADLVYEYSRNSFEQNVILREQLTDIADCGFAEDERVWLAVITAFPDAPEPQRRATPVDLEPHYRALGLERQEILPDDTLTFGSMRIIEGKSFRVGHPERSVPSGKAWQTLRGPEGTPCRFLIESTPYRLLQPHLETLPPRTAAVSPPAPQGLETVLAAVSPPRATESPAALMAQVSPRPDTTPGVVLDYLMVTTPILNVDFGWGGKSGLAAFGQGSGDYWNVYHNTGSEPGTLAHLYWSDGSGSSVGLVVTNAPGVGANPFCLDPMYQSFIHPTAGGTVSVTLTNLPAGEYDVVVYAARASAAGAPMIELRRGGTPLWHKGTTLWGSGWYASAWEEGEQFVRYRNLTVTNQALVLIASPDAAGYASLSGVQIIPSAALPADEPEYSALLNVNFGGSAGAKVGPAVAGLTAGDYWNPYVQGGYAVSVPNLLWSDQTGSGVGLSVWNAPGTWGNSYPDLMFRSYKYAYSSGAITFSLTNLPAGVCDVYLYGHATATNDNAIFEVWSGAVAQGIKGTSLKGCGYTSNAWEIGQQYVRFADVVVTPSQPLLIQARHSPAGYNNLSGLQIAWKGDADTDADGLPDAWEHRWFGALTPEAGDDPDADGLTNLREYLLALDPTRTDSDGDGLADGQDYEFVWVEDAVPQGGFATAQGGDTWTWVSSWSDGIGWNGGTVTPHSGQKLRVSANTTNLVHQHYFDRAVACLRPGTGDVLYAWINLDPTRPPAEVMLQFATMEPNGSYSWEHRAFWGANSLNYGTYGTASRYPMGALPTAGQWVRLTVPAGAVGLEGRIIEGVAFTLYSGRAAWDSAGALKPDLDGDGTADLDGDGLSDAWELAWFGHLNQGADGDPDGDGYTNLWEYRYGLNPTVYNSMNGLGGTTPFLIFTPLK